MIVAAACPAIQLQRVSKAFGGLPVLHDLNLTVRTGKTVLLLAGNGSGKSTLLRLIASSLRPSQGQVQVMGFDSQRQAAQLRAQLAYLGTLGGNYAALSALENLQLAARLYHQDTSPARLMALLAQVGLETVAQQRVMGFSSGMHKRLAIARVLLADKPLWLLDEPYSALDENGKDQLDALLQQAKDEGRTVVFASHEAQRSTPHADSVLSIRQGRLVPYR